MSSIVGMKAVAKLIKEETQEGHNTAARVGGLFEDIVGYLDSADVASSLEITPYVTTGTRIAKFKVNGEETTIYAPSNGGGGSSGGGGSASDIAEIQAAIDALDDALDSTTKLANDEKDRLNDLVKGIGEDISGRMKDALEFAEWIRGNHPEGETFFESGWNDKTKEFMQTVGLWDTDEATTRTRWTYYKQNYNTIAAAVSAINDDGNFSTFLQGLIEETITDESVQTSISNTYARKDNITDIINWMYSGLKGSASEYETFNDLVSAASNGTSSAISEVRTYVNVVKNGEVLNYVANTNMATKVDNALTELYQTATPGYSSTSIFSQVKQDSTDIAALVQKITNDTSSTTVANKIAQWQAGFVTQATLEGAFASMIAADSDYSTVAAIVNTVNDAGSTIKLNANKIDFSSGVSNFHTDAFTIENNTIWEGSLPGYRKLYFADGYHSGFNVVFQKGDIAPGLEYCEFGIANSYGHTGDFYEQVQTSTDSNPRDLFRFSVDGSGSLGFGKFTWNTTSVNIYGTSSVNITGSTTIYGTLSAGNITGNDFTCEDLAASGEITASDGFNLGIYNFKVITISKSSYLRISPSNGTTGIYMNADGRLGVVINNSFKPSLDFDDYYSHHSTRTPGLGEFLTNTGSDLNNYYIRNGLIVEG